MHGTNFQTLKLKAKIGLVNVLYHIFFAVLHLVSRNKTEN